MGAYSGVPCFFLVLLGPAFEPLARAIGDIAAVWTFLAIFLVIVGISLAIFDRIPRRIILPLGFSAWSLTFAIACFYGLRKW